MQDSWRIIITNLSLGATHSRKHQSNTRLRTRLYEGGPGVLSKYFIPKSQPLELCLFPVKFFYRLHRIHLLSNPTVRYLRAYTPQLTVSIFQSWFFYLLFLYTWANMETFCASFFLIYKKAVPKQMNTIRHIERCLAHS